MVWDKLAKIWRNKNSSGGESPPAQFKYNRVHAIAFNDDVCDGVELDYLAEPYNLSNPFPHCNQFILHKPKLCEYCDKHPDWQQERVDKKVNFTGEQTSGFALCPADTNYKSDPNWPGNKPGQASTASIIAEAIETTTKNLFDVWKQPKKETTGFGYVEVPKVIKKT
jgi:hypothetical protein